MKAKLVVSGKIDGIAPDLAQRLNQVLTELVDSPLFVEPAISVSDGEFAVIVTIEHIELTDDQAHRGRVGVIFDALRAAGIGTAVQLLGGTLDLAIRDIE